MRKITPNCNGGAYANSQIPVQAKPDSLLLDIDKTAVIVVDMQNEFGSKGGLFDRIGINISPIQAVVGPIARVLKSARRVGFPIVCGRP